MYAFRFLIPILFLILSAKASASVDYLAVNHITKEIYWGDEDHEAGLIGWRTVPDGKNHLEKIYKQKGYTLTSFPFKIELVGLAIIGVLITIFLAFNKRKKTTRLFE